MVLRFLWDHLVFTQYSYYRYFFCSGPASRLFDLHPHVWVQYIYATKKLRFDVCNHCYCLLIYDDYVILICFILNWTMLQWWNGGWWNKEYDWLCFLSQISNLFILFISEHNSFAADKETHTLQFLITNNKYSNQAYLIILRIIDKQNLIWYCNA